MSVAERLLGRVSNDRLTALKLIAVLTMVVDHYNKFFNPDYSQIMFAAGRLALPLFLFVMAFNLARMDVSKIPNMAQRLLVFGMLATPAYNALGGAVYGGWWPLNILFLLAGFAIMVYLERVQPVSRGLLFASKAGAVAVFLVTGAVAEFFWAGLLVGWGLYRFIWQFSPGRKEQGGTPVELIITSVALALGVAGLLVVNDNAWALAGAWVVLAVLYLPVRPLPRCKWLFYWFYPVHLWVLWAF